MTRVHWSHYFDPGRGYYEVDGYSEELQNIQRLAAFNGFAIKMEWDEGRYEISLVRGSHDIYVKKFSTLWGARRQIVEEIRKLNAEKGYTISDLGFATFGEEDPPTPKKDEICGP